MHAAALGLLCIPLCVDVFALMGRDGICFLPLLSGCPPESIQVAVFFVFFWQGTAAGIEGLLHSA